jgi:hypothetical protein
MPGPTGHRFGGVWAAPAAPKTISEGGGLRPDLLAWCFIGRRGRPDPNNRRIPADPKTTYKKPQVYVAYCMRRAPLETMLELERSPYVAKSSRRLSVPFAHMYGFHRAPHAGQMNDPSSCFAKLFAERAELLGMSLMDV